MLHLFGQLPNRSQLSSWSAEVARVARSASYALGLEGAGSLVRLASPG